MQINKFIIALLFIILVIIILYSSYIFFSRSSLRTSSESPIPLPTQNNTIDSNPIAPNNNQEQPSISLLNLLNEQELLLKSEYNTVIRKDTLIFASAPLEAGSIRYKFVFKAALPTVCHTFFTDISSTSDYELTVNITISKLKDDISICIPSQSLVSFEGEYIDENNKEVVLNIINI